MWDIFIVEETADSLESYSGVPIASPCPPGSE